MKRNIQESMATVTLLLLYLDDWITYCKHSLLSTGESPCVLCVLLLCSVVYMDRLRL